MALLVQFLVEFTSVQKEPNAVHVEELLKKQGEVQRLHVHAIVGLSDDCHALSHFALQRCRGTARRGAATTWRFARWMTEVGVMLCAAQEHVGHYASCCCRVCAAAAP